MARTDRIGPPLSVLPTGGEFRSRATTMEQYNRDVADFLLAQRRRDGTVTPGTGTTKPVEYSKIRSFSDIMNAVLGWNKDQKVRKGGAAFDKGDAPYAETYRQRRFDFLEESEGLRRLAYDDKTGAAVTSGPVGGNVTVGVGFNMDRPDAKDVWFNALGKDDADFQKVYKGERRLDMDEVQRLFDYNIKEAEDFVSNRFRNVDLREHQRLALVSLAFHNPSLIGPNLTQQVRDGQWRAASLEILHRSNKRRHRGIAKRRWREAKMFEGVNPQATSLPDFGDYMKGFA